MTANTIATNKLIDRATRRIGEDIRVRVGVLTNEAWRQQIVASYDYFESGGEGFTLRDLGRE